MSELDRVRERVRQNRTQQRADIGRQSTQTTTPEARIGVRLLPGQRVFDRETGEEGVILGGTRESVLVPVTDRTHD